MFHGHLDHFQKPPLGGRPNTKRRDPGPDTWIEVHWNKKYLVEGAVTYDFALHLRIRDHTTWFWRCVGTALWTLSFRLSQFHGHGSWLVCEVALTHFSFSFLFFSKFQQHCKGAVGLDIWVLRESYLRRWQPLAPPLGRWFREVRSNATTIAR